MGLAKLFALAMLVHVVRISGRWRLAAAFSTSVIIVSGFFENPGEPQLARRTALGLAFALPFFFLVNRTNKPIAWGLLLVGGVVATFLIPW